MFGGEIRELLIQVISSWQIIAVTVILVIYISLVNYVARTRRRSYHRPPVRKTKTKPAATETQITTDTDELGLEEQ